MNLGCLVKTCRIVETHALYLSPKAGVTAWINVNKYFLSFLIACECLVEGQLKQEHIPFQYLSLCLPLAHASGVFVQVAS